VNLNIDTYDKHNLKQTSQAIRDLSHYYITLAVNECFPISKYLKTESHTRDLSHYYITLAVNECFPISKYLKTESHT